ncbi:MAG: LPS export ABC transporter periplasmic protein LptC [Bacteroidota bacterium]|nr:LPS export ABC transporter periplasmic protein LptC [Bacteroidota bacterium]
MGIYLILDAGLINQLLFVFLNQIDLLMSHNFVALALIFLISCSNDPDILRTFINKDNLPVEQSTQVTILHTEYGNIKIKLEAALVERFNNSATIIRLSKGLKMQFYDDSLNIISVLSSDEGILDENSNVMKANGNVILTGKDRKKLSSQELIWDVNNDLIFTEKEVQITIGEDVIRGYGFKSTSDFSSYELSKVSGDMQLIN